MILIGTWYLVVTKNRNYFGTSSDVGVGVGSVLMEKSKANRHRSY